MDAQSNPPRQPASHQDTPPVWVKDLLDRVDPLFDLAAMHAAGKRRDNWWAGVRRIFLATAVTVLAGIWGYFQLKAWGVQSDPLKKSIAVIPIQGPIMRGMEASADRIVSLIERACAADNVEALLLHINSPGGAPTESERMVAAVKACRAGTDDKPGKQVVSLIDGTGASAAYMVAASTEEIYAGRYSIVGSIGAILRYTDVSELAHRFGVHEKVFRSAELKGGPSMISGTTALEEQTMQDLVNAMAQEFLSEVVEARGEKIKLPEQEVASGRVWTSEDALAAGLIDQVAVIEDLKRERFKDKPLFWYSTKPSIAEQMGLTQLASQWLAALQGPRFE